MAYDDPPLTPPKGGGISLPSPLGGGAGVGFCFGHQLGICSMTLRLFIRVGPEMGKVTAKIAP